MEFKGAQTLFQPISFGEMCYLKESYEREKN